MDNLFENAWFGKPYRTQDERKALFSRLVGNDDYTAAILYLEHSYAEIECTLDGRYYDWVGGKQKFWYDSPYIVSEWHESAETDPEALATEHCSLLRDTLRGLGESVDMADVHDAFIKGYRAAKERHEGKIKA